MKRPILYNQLKKSLDKYQQNINLPGINTPVKEHAFLLQLIDSISRIKYITILKTIGLSQLRKDPSNSLFDPLKAAILLNREGDDLEAIWLVFLFTHFGKNKKSGYGLLKCFYGKNNIGESFSYLDVLIDIQGCKLWIHTNQLALKNSGSFSNHRKYQSTQAYNNAGTGSTIESFINWIGDDLNVFKSHIPLNILSDKNLLFDYLYEQSFKNIVGFGRLACFDFVTMLGKIGIFDCEPASPYLQYSTGPIVGTKLLFGTPVGTSNNDLNDYLTDLGDHLAHDIGIDYSMQVLEDAVCNWQKSPNNYIYFTG